jgi:REP-associated tyrosine transposase
MCGFGQRGCTRGDNPLIGVTRPLRLDHEGAVWHVTSRGNARSCVFRDDTDRREFVDVLARVVERAAWLVHAFVLMGNHYHLLLETPERTLSKGMHLLNGVFTQRVNRRWKRVGHLFQGRYKSILVERETHLLELMRYVVLNPVRAGIVSQVEQWPWSNFLATAGIVAPPPWLEVRWTLAQFPPPSMSRQRYRDFVSAGVGQKSPLANVTGQIYLGGDDFRKRVQARVDSVAPSLEHPEAQRRPVRPTIDAVLAVTARYFDVELAALTRHNHSRARLAAALLARTDAGLKLKDFCDPLAVKRWAACNLANRAQRLWDTDPAFRSDVAEIRAILAKTTLSQT